MKRIQKKESGLICPYNTVYSYNTDWFKYSFFTHESIEYNICFSIPSYDFPSQFNDKIFVFGFTPENGYAKNDERIKLTVIECIKEFITANPDVSLVFPFLRDKHAPEVRFRLFSIWYNHLTFNHNIEFGAFDIFKENEKILIGFLTKKSQSKQSSIKNYITNNFQIFSK